MLSNIRVKAREDHRHDHPRGQAGRDRSTDGMLKFMSHAELQHMLGGPKVSPDGYRVLDEQVLPLTRVHLMPGDVLYAAGSPANYGYIVERGVLQCVRQTSPDAGDAVRHVAAGGLLGVGGFARARHETVRAITEVSLLAMPMDVLQQLESESPLMRELMARPLGQGLMQDWRMVYRLRDLPPYARTVAGLGYILDLIGQFDPGADDESSVPVAIEIANLACWLGLSENALTACLRQLYRYDAMQWRDGFVRALVPQVLRQVGGALRSWQAPRAETQSRRQGVAPVLATLAGVPVSNTAQTSTPVPGLLPALEHGALP